MKRGPLAAGTNLIRPLLAQAERCQEEQTMSTRMLIAALSTLLLAAACVPQTLSVGVGPPAPTIIPSPTRTAPPPASTSAPAPQPVHTPTAATPPVDCVMHGGSPPPSLPDTDCRAWEMLHSLMSMTHGMANKRPPSTPSQLLTLETELTPLFVQAQLNCGQWVEPYNDYEPITDMLGFLSFLGLDSYGYDPPSLLRFLIEEASTEEFAQESDSIGCVKALLLLFVAYAE